MVLPVAGLTTVSGDGAMVSTVMATLVDVMACPLGLSSDTARIAGPSARAGAMIQLHAPVGPATAEHVSPFGPVTTMVDPGVAPVQVTVGVGVEIVDPLVGAVTESVLDGTQFGRHAVRTLKFVPAMRMTPLPGMLACPWKYPLASIRASVKLTHPRDQLQA